jgi:uncharacterized protein YkwD
MRGVVVGALVVIVCWGCGPQVVAGGLSGPRVNGPLTLVPLWQPAARYNDPVGQPPPSALGNALLAAVRDSAVRTRTPVPVADARLFRACAELAQVVPEEGVIPYSLVEFALQHHGIIEPSPHLLVVWGDISAPRRIVDQLRPRLEELVAAGVTARVGIGVATRMPDGRGAVVFALQSSGVTTSPIPRSAQPGGSFAIDAVVDARYRNPKVNVTRHDGSVESIDLRATNPGAFSAQVHCGSAPGKQQIAITANDAAGPTVLANFPVWCGAEPPQSLTVVASRDDLPVADAAEAERRVFEIVNRDRERAGLPSLLWDELIADVARGHSREMRNARVVAHVVPPTGSLIRRVQLARRDVVAHTNIARAYGIGEAHQGLMNVPSTRATLMSTLATHVAVGVVLGDEVGGRRELYITQVITYVRPKVDPAQVAETVRSRIAAIHPVGSNPEVDAIAQALADGIAGGRTRAQAYAVLKPRVDALARQYAHIGSAITNVIELDAIDAASMLGDAKPDDIGVGIAQGTHAELGDSVIFLVVLLATRR